MLRYEILWEYLKKYLIENYIELDIIIQYNQNNYNNKHYE